MFDNLLSRMEVVAEGFSFPTSIAFDDDGLVYVAESGLPFGGAAPGGVFGALRLMVDARCWLRICDSL